MRRLVYRIREIAVQAGLSQATVDRCRHRSRPFTDDGKLMGFLR
jgi:hypothetical protein